MPLLGLGVFELRPGAETEGVVSDALELGYRLIDTARIYNNEADVGRAISRSGVPREEVFITTKLWNTDHGLEECLYGFEESRERLGVQYVDLFLIHWPVEKVRLQTWRALESLLEMGDCRAIGVSNYTSEHLDEIIGLKSRVPSINQVEFSPFLYQRHLLEKCVESGIHLQAYSPLTQGRRIGDEVVKEIAATYEVEPAQILLRWALQRGVSAVAKSRNRTHLANNLKIFSFSLGSEDLSRLDGLHENYRTCWDPTLQK